MSVSAPDFSTYPEAPALSDSNRNCSLSCMDSISIFSSGLRLCSSAAAWMPVMRGHRHVEDREVNVVLESLLDRLGPVLGLGDDLEVRLRVEHLLEAFADDRE